MRWCLLVVLGAMLGVATATVVDVTATLIATP
jgi:hypothetical protein